MSVKNNNSHTNISRQTKHTCALCIVHSHVYAQSGPLFAYLYGWPFFSYCFLGKFAHLPGRSELNYLQCLLRCQTKGTNHFEIIVGEAESWCCCCLLSLLCYGLLRNWKKNRKTTNKNPMFIPKWHLPELGIHDQNDHHVHRRPIYPTSSNKQTLAWQNIHKRAVMRDFFLNSNVHRHKNDAKCISIDHFVFFVFHWKDLGKEEKKTVFYVQEFNVMESKGKKKEKNWAAKRKTMEWKHMKRLCDAFLFPFNTYTPIYLPKWAEIWGWGSML